MTDSTEPIRCPCCGLLTREFEAVATYTARAAAPQAQPSDGWVTSPDGMSRRLAAPHAAPGVPLAAGSKTVAVAFGDVAGTYADPAGKFSPQAQPAPAEQRKEDERAAVEFYTRNPSAALLDFGRRIDGTWLARSPEPAPADDPDTLTIAYQKGRADERRAREPAPVSDAILTRWADRFAAMQDFKSATEVRARLAERGTR